jgi:hypothetical protein
VFAACYQAVAAGSAHMAAMDAEKFLEAEHHHPVGVSNAVRP